MSRLSRALVAAAALAAFAPSGAGADGASLTPSSTVLRLDAGQSRRVDFALSVRVPARPVDVYLLVDTSAATAPHLPALRRSLKDAVARSGPNVRFGVGELRTTGAGDWTGGVTYRTLRKVGPADAGLERAIDRLGQDAAGPAASLGGEVAHTVALDEAVTGDGYDPYVAPGHDAGFRGDARRVVALVTAEAFANDPLQPTRDEAVSALRAAGANVVGLAIGPAALGDLAAVAAGTGSVASADVDCGRGRVRRGQPAACVVAPDALAAPLARLLLRRERAEATFAVSGTGVRRFDAPARQVDRGTTARIPLRLDVACAEGDAGRVHDVAVTARLDGDPVARASLRVECH
jgi:hypothetical protein